MLMCAGSREKVRAIGDIAQGGGGKAAIQPAEAVGADDLAADGEYRGVEVGRGGLLSDLRVSEGGEGWCESRADVP